MKKARRRALHHQVDRLRRRLAALRWISYRYSWIRLALFIVGLLTSGAAFYLVGVGLVLVSVSVFVLLFGIAVYYHRQINESIERHQVWLQIKSAHIARMGLDWERIPTSFGHRPQYQHPFEADLDVVGEHSLFRLIDTAVSYEGSRRLRAWLTTPVPQGQQTLRRQQLVRELTPLSLFRDKLILNTTIAPGARRTWDAEQLSAWLERHAPAVSLQAWLLLASTLAVLNVVLFVVHRVGWIPPIWQITFVLYLGLILAKSRATGEVFEEAATLKGALRQLGAAFGQLEDFSYHSTPHLKTLCAPFLDDRHRPSTYLRRITRVLAAMGVRGNPIAWLALNAVLPWDFVFTRRLNKHKAELAQYAPIWMDVWFDLEALSSLANLAYLNPGYTFPDFLTDERPEPTAVFDAQRLGHPLIPDHEKVCNDFTIAELGGLTIITGSNMAGKSVFLKTVGVNLALAYAGGPVNAWSLTTSLFRLFTSIQVTDSVTDGISYFYAEVQRLKALLSQLEGDHTLPLFFFIDEIFRGTNNRERLLGSLAYMRALVDKNGVGLIATHDLELTKLADRIPEIRNHHFRDAVLDGRMVFDYTLRAGPCPTTNALKIMEMEGLPVPSESYRRSGS